MSSQSALLSPSARRVTAARKPRRPRMTPAQMKMHVNICESYSQRKGEFDLKAKNHKTPAIKGLKIAFDEANKPELAYNTTRDYWRILRRRRGL